jgi:hypothetical protein
MAITALEASAVPSWGRRPVKMRHPGPQPRRLDHHRRPTATRSRTNPNLRTATQRFPGVAGIAVHRFTPYRAVAA